MAFRSRQFLLLACLVVLALATLVVPPGAAQDVSLYGVRTFDPEPRPLPATDGRLLLCADSTGGAVELRQETDEGAFTHTLVPGGRLSSCARVAAGGTLVSAAGPVDVLVMQGDARLLRTPGTVRLDAPGSAVVVQDATGAALFGALLPSPDDRVVVVRLQDLAVLASFEGVGEEKARVDAAPGTVFFVLTGASGSDAAVRVLWEDPDWYPRTPSIGAIAAVVVSLLLVVLYHGRSPRRMG